MPIRIMEEYTGPAYVMFAWHRVGWNAAPYGTLHTDTEQGRDSTRITVGKVHPITPQDLDEFQTCKGEHEHEWEKRAEAYVLKERVKPPRDFIPRFSIIKFFERKFPLPVDA